MSPTPTSCRVPMRNHRQKETRKQSGAAYAPTPQMPPIPHSSSSSAANIKKPMRPLTGYHIFFQIEREHIIQSAAVTDAEKSIHANKSYLPDVPRRYRCTKLLPDWYAGPGKRQKRKHRKSHGKIGFLELSRVISRKWATLDSTDPETKQYVTRIAAQELKEYKVEMEQYKILTEAASNPASAEQPVGSVVNAAKMGAAISPSASPSPTFCSSSHVPLTEYCMPLVESAKLVLSLDQEFASASVASNEDEIDYSICTVSNNGHYIPSPGPALIYPDDSTCDPLFELENDCGDLQQSCMKRCVSPVSSDMNADVISGEYLL